MKRDSSTTGSRSSDHEKSTEKSMTDKLKVALKKILAEPWDVEAWNQAEALAAELQRPDEVAAAYRKILVAGASPELITSVGQRALRFLEDWYAGETAVVVDLLESVLELDPGADWALERLTILRSVNQQWDELLTAYDAALQGLPDGPRRRRLLQDAASVARDSGNIARAASYLRTLFEAAPGIVEVSVELEHLLEKLGDYATLASVLTTRLAVVSGHDANEVRQHLAGLYLDHLQKPDKALDEIERILQQPALVEDVVPCTLAERVLAEAGAEPAVRRRALGILRSRHTQQRRLDRVVAALRVALTFATPEETRALIHEAADTLERQGDLAAAREHLVDLVAFQPEETATRARLKYLAEVTASPAAYVRGLLAAADATQNAPLQVALWLEAAQIEEARPDGASQAIVLFRKILAGKAATTEQVLLCLRKLAALIGPDADERLDILEQQAKLESPSVRRALLGEAADVARARGQIDRALGLWNERLAADASDRKALAKTIEILQGAERWQELVVALRRRASADVPWIQRRADLARVAELERDRLHDEAKAIAALSEILASAASDADAVAAILDLFVAAGRFQDLLTLGTRIGDETQIQLVALLVRLGDACRSQLGDSPGAAAWYGRALAIEPRAPGLRDALLALVQDDVARAAAVEGIVRASAATEDWQALLAVLPHRLASAASDAERVSVYREAAALEEKRAQNAGRALGHHIEILKLRPDDVQAEADTVRLATATGDFAAAAQAIEQASATAVVARKAQLLLLASRLLDENVGDKVAALAAAQKAAEATPADRSTRLRVIRLASVQGAWQVAVDAAFDEPFDGSALVGEFLPAMEKAAREPSARQSSDAGESLRVLGTMVSAAVAKRRDLGGPAARAIEERIADYPVPADKAEAWREKALARARDYEPSSVPTLRALANVQRGRAGKPLCETLLQIAALVPTDLESLVRALDLAEQENDPTLLRNVLALLFDRAAGLLRMGQAVGKPSAADCLVRAARGLSAQLGTSLDSADKADVHRAIAYLLEASRLPIAADAAQALRARAGELAMQVDQKLARELLRQAVDENAENAGSAKNREAVKALGKLYEEADLPGDLLALRRRELDLGGTADERLALRLDIARLGEIVESRTGRFETLLANLDDCPGHAATLEALGQLLRSRARFAELADILAGQARKLEEQGDALPAAQRWSEAALLFEEQLRDPARAISAYEKVAQLSADPAAMDALARLYEAAGEPLTAASWLELRMSAGAPADKREGVIKLAQTYLDGGQRHRAVAALERALGEDPEGDLLWTMLARLHREAGHHEALLRVLVAHSIHTQDAQKVLACAREALALCQNKLAELAQAVPVLERAAALVPEERTLRLALADGLRLSGRLSEARTVLEGLLQEYGRRQSRERAGLHLQIAMVARAEKNPELAAKHLDQAAAVLLDSVDVQLALAEVAEERGELERAEKAYRALLVLARRGHGEGAMTAGQVLVRLRRIAIKQNHVAQAAEHLESALARAQHDPVEARKIQAALLADGDSETLLELLSKRQAAAAHLGDEATIVCERARALESIGRAEEGLAAVLEVLGKVPDNVEAHELGRRMAVPLGKAAAYLDVVAGAAERLRRADDAGTLADLLLRAADVAESDLQDLDRAQSFLRRAEQTSRRGADVWSSIARVAAKAGNAAEAKRAVAGLRRLATAAVSDAEKGDVLFRLAEALVPEPESRGEGLDFLAQAVEAKADLARATAIVRDAQVPDAELTRVMPVYEKVARASGDERVLLEFLERRASVPGAGLVDIREGVELAVSLGEGERAERMLRRAIEAANASNNLREAVWAVGDLSRRLRTRGDMVSAAQVLQDAREEWGNPRLTPLVRETAKAAFAMPEYARIAADLLNHLRALYPTDRDVWEPLLNLWARLGERERLQSLVGDLVEKLMGRGDRSAVRMAWARFLQKSGDVGDAIPAALRDVLLEEPGHVEALSLLADTYEQRGDVNEAVTLLSDALSVGDAAMSGAARGQLARRLGDLVRKADPAQAKMVYRSALSGSLPDPTLKRSLQLALAELLTGEDELVVKASLLEEILLGDSGDEAAARALALVDLRQGSGDDQGAERALALGRQRAPESPELFDRLTKFYTEHERWRSLVDLLREEADRQTDAEKATRLLRKVAHLQRGKLGEGQAAAQTLRRAVLADPSDFDLVRELCDSLVEAGEPGQAVAAVGEILTPETPPAVRVGLLRLRAEMAVRTGDDLAAIADLEEALGLGANEVVADLIGALSRVAERMDGDEQKQIARTATFRLAEILRASDEHDKADQALFRWVEASPDDRDALCQMRDIFVSAERWESAANVWARLVHIEDGEGKAQAALALTDICEKLGRGEDAVPWLVSVLAHLPGHRGLQARLADLYARTGNVAESARLRNEMADSEPDENERFSLYVQIGQTLLAVGEGAEAASALEKALALRAADRPARALLLDAYTVAGALDRAIAILNELLADAKAMKAEELALLYQRQSKLAAAMGDKDGQLQALKKALDVDRRSVSIANELADLAESIGDDELALRALRVVAANPVKDAKVLSLAYFRQARIAHRAKDRSRAIIFVKRALQEDPQLDEARALLDQLR